MRALLVVAVVVAGCTPATTSKPPNPPDSPRPSLEIIELALGANHVCALRGDRTVWCWGNNEFGQLDQRPDRTGVPRYSPTPTRVARADGATKLFADGNKTCARDAAGKLGCWGGEGHICSAFAGEVTCLGIAVDATALRDALDVDADEDEACGLFTGGRVACVRATDGKVFERATDATSISVVHHHGCAVRATGGVICWGSNSSYALGVRKNSETGPIDMPDVHDAIAVAATVLETCIVHRDRTVTCVGGGDSSPKTALPRTMPIADATTISLGASFGCAIDTTHRVQCWGEDDYGQLGKPALADRELDEPLPGIAGATDLVGWDNTTCAHVGDQWICWGDSNAAGDTYIDVPHPEPRLDGATQVAVGGLRTCFVRDAKAWCWEYRAETPVDQGLTDVVEVQLGFDHTCARMANRTVACWVKHEKPRVVPGITDAIGVTTDLHMTCIARASGPLACTGFDKPPYNLTVPPGATRVRTDGQFVCGIMQDKTVQCAGANPYGSLGDGTLEDQAAPRAVPGVANVVDLTPQPCALLGDGTVRCWGKRDRDRALGLGRSSVIDCNLGYSPSPCVRSPTKLPIEDVVQLVTGNGHSCARMRDGTVRCWGNYHAGRTYRGLQPAVVVPIDPRDGNAPH